MAENTELLEQIADILSQQLNISKDKVTKDSDIVKDLGADSLDVVELLMTLEENTGKTIPEEKVADIKTVGELIAILETL